MDEKDLQQFKTALSRYLYISETKRSLNHFLPVEKVLDVMRHIVGLLKKHFGKRQ